MQHQTKTILFCGKKNCCPEVNVKQDRVVIGGQEEGYTRFSHQNFSDLIKAAKDGKFDDYVSE